MTEDEIGLSIARVEAQVESNAKDIATMAKSIEKMSDVVSASQKTNWIVVLGGVGTFITVMLLYVSPFGEKQRELQSAILRLEQAERKHIEDGHPYRVEQRLEAIKDDVKDTKIASSTRDRELRLWLNKLVARVDDLANTVAKLEGKNGH